MSGVDRIHRERERQKTKWGANHDAVHTDGSLAQAASFLACQSEHKPQWAYSLLHKNKDDRLRQLEIAGALIAAEIDRLIRILNKT